MQHCWSHHRYSIYSHTHSQCILTCLCLQCIYMFFFQAKPCPSIPKTAIITLFGLFEFLRMSFGLRNTSQTRYCKNSPSATYTYLDGLDNTYLLTCTDHFTHWPEGISPLQMSQPRLSHKPSSLVGLPALVHL